MGEKVRGKKIIAVLLAAVVVFVIVLACLMVWAGGKEVNNSAKTVELRSVRIMEAGEEGVLSASAEGNQGGDDGQASSLTFDAVRTPEPDMPSSADGATGAETLPSPSAEPVSSGESMEPQGQREPEPEGESEQDGASGEVSGQEPARPEGIDPSLSVPDRQEDERLPGGTAPGASPDSYNDGVQKNVEGAGETPAVPSGESPAETLMPEASPEPDAASGRKWKVTYYLPYIALSYDVNGVVFSDIREVSPSVYKNVDVADGASLDRPWNPIVFMTPFGYTTAKADISFAGWCTADGAEWDFNQDTVWADTELYPVWMDGGGSRYYTVIYNAPEVGFYCCNSLKEGSVGYERPAFGGAGYSVPQRDGYVLAGWEKKNQGNAIWGAWTEVVDGFESLGAVWLPQGADVYVAAYVTGGEGGYGDLVDLFVVEQGSGCPAPARPLSDGIILPEGAQGQPVDWLGDDGSYRDVTAEGGNHFYIFRAFWGMQGNDTHGIVK